MKKKTRGKKDAQNNKARRKNAAVRNNKAALHTNPAQENPVTPTNNPAQTPPIPHTHPTPSTPHNNKTNPDIPCPFALWGLEQIKDFFFTLLSVGFKNHYNRTNIIPVLQPALMGKDALWFATQGIKLMHQWHQDFKASSSSLHFFPVLSRSIRRQHLWNIIYPLLL
jgi:hypothetical protein